MGAVSVRFRDYSKEGSGLRLATPAITSGNIADYTTAVTGHIALLTTALNALT